jgi:hypothetical protein
MDHTYIEERGLIDLYHRGQIPPEEEIEFEEHFVGCAACQDRLAMARGFQRGLKTVVAEDAARAVAQAGIAAWLVRRRWLAAAVLVLAVLLPAVGFLAGNRGARDAVASWKDRWETERLSASKLERMLAESERRRQEGQEERRALEEKLAQARPPETTPPSPLVNTPLILLTAVRGEPAEPQVVHVGGSSYFTLAVDAGDDSRFASYRATVTDSKGARVFRQADLKPNALEAILLTFPTSYFKPGEYRLALEGVLPDGGTVELGVHPFRIVR